MSKVTLLKITNGIYGRSCDNTTSEVLAGRELSRSWSKCLHVVHGRDKGTVKEKVRFNGNNVYRCRPHSDCVVVDMGRIKWPRPSGKENKIQLHLVWWEIKG